MPAFYRYSFRFTVCIFLLFITSACTVKIVYNQLDWILADHLESYVELDNEQQKALYRHLDKTMLWHKSSQLPLYVKWLQDFKSDINNQPKYAAIEKNMQGLRVFIRVLRSHAANELASLLPTLTGAQRQELYSSMELKNKDFADDFIHISREEQIEQYIERTEDRFDEWLDSITPAQEDMIRHSAKTIQPVASEVLKTRQRWQAEFKNILETNTSTKAQKQAIHELFVNADKFRSEKYQRNAVHNQQVFVRLIIDVTRIMTKQQHRYFNDKVDNYSRHFTEMAEVARLEISHIKNGATSAPFF